MEFAASVAGLIGIVGTVKTCIDLLDIISTGRRVIKDLDTFILQIHTQRIIFILWCEITGLTDLARKVEAARNHAPVAIEPSEVGSLLMRSLSSKLLLSHAQSIMTDMERTLKAAQKLLSSYDGEGQPPSSFQNLIRGRKKGMALAQISQISESVLDNDKRVWKRTPWKGIKWAASGKQECSRLLSNLTTHINGLRAILDMIDRSQAARLQSWVEANAAAPNMSRVLLTAHEQATVAGANALLDGGEQTTLISLSQISHRGVMVQDFVDQEPENTSKSPDVHIPAAGTGTEQSLQIDVNGLLITELLEEASPERQFGSYRGQQVVVEWRYYSTRISLEHRALLDYQIYALSMQLNQSSSIPLFGISPCLGSFHSESNSRYGLVFAMPDGSMPISLSECLKKDYKAGKLRDLESRLRLAKSIVLSLLRFFSVGWLHKNIRSSNILFFDTPLNVDALPDPHLFGFGFARRESVRRTATEPKTEFFPSVLHSLPANREWRLYCHPKRDQMIMSQVSPGLADATASSVTSNMLFDAYGLGIILLEIGLWCPVIKICSGSETVEQFQQSVVSKRMTQLQFNVGTRYANIVQRLLKSDFAAEDEEALSSQELVEAFEKLVVHEMEMLIH